MRARQDTPDDDACHAVDGGVGDPVHDSQRVFRAVLDAMARPGTVQRINAQANPPHPMAPVLAAITLTLADADTPLWLDPTLRGSGEVLGWLAFHTGAPLVDAPADAVFALVTDGAALPPLEAFAQGNDAYPDRSTTLILAVETLENGTPHTLTGPGIKDRATLFAAPLPAHFAAQWAANRARFPRGVDLVFAAPGALAALPRTTAVS